MPSGGGGSAPATTTQVVQQDVPEFLQQSYLDVINRAKAQSEAPYTAYQGQRIAPFTPLQQQSFDLTQQGIGSYQPTLQQGINSTSAAATPFNQSTFNQFMDPYQQQVTDEISRLGNRNFSENILPQVNSQFTGNGMFGSSRNADILSRAARDTQADITGQQAQYLSSGFQNQMQNYNAAQNRALQAGSQLGQLATTGQAMNTNDVSALAAAGQQQQQQQQQLADVAYNQFLEQQQYPEAQTAFYSNVAHGINPTGLVTSSVQNYGSNPLAQAVGIGGTLYNAVNKAKGGRVKAKGAMVKAKLPRKKSDAVGLGNMAYA